MHLTEKQFDFFVDRVVANMARASIKTIQRYTTSTVTVKQGKDFQRGHKCDLTVYKASMVVNACGL